jgi:NADH-ubiquinone oxidoreductase chain 6
MQNLFIFNETITNGFIPQSVDIFSLAAILSGIFVIITKNPIVSVLFLIGLFLSISCYLITLGLNFIGLSYLLVYVGAVSILFLFILMLINIRVSELVSDTSNSIPLAILIIIAFNYPVNKVLPYKLGAFTNNFSDSMNDNNSYLNNIIKFVQDVSNTKSLDSNEIYFVTSKL